METKAQVYLQEQLVGNLIYQYDGKRETCSFKYDDSWLQAPERFPLSPDLPLNQGYQTKSSKKDTSVFFDCIADTEPNGWGKKVILRDFALQRKKAAQPNNLPTSLNSMDFLLWIDDYSRQGSLRFKVDGEFRNITPEDRRKAPPVLDFKHLISASNAIELNQETQRDLDYLRGIGSDLDGMRPKCTVIDTAGNLCLAKFPSVEDERSITSSEILALHLAKMGGIDVVDSRLVTSGKCKVALIKRFDRQNDQRRMYLSAASMIGDFNGQSDHAYTELVDVLRQKGANTARDSEELWRRMVYNILIKNVDDHLHNHGFLQVRGDTWSLSPAFDINPFPEKQHELKLWIREDMGPSGSIDEAMQSTGYFGLKNERAKEILNKLLNATSQWQSMAHSLDITNHDIEQLSPAFIHEERNLANRIVSAKSMPRSILS